MTRQAPLTPFAFMRRQHWLTAAVAPIWDCICAGFRTPAATSYPRAPEAGVRKAPRHEIAGGRPRSAVPLAQLWGFKRRTCRVRAARGRLIAQGTACWRACAERCEARKARIERLFVGREKNLCELTRADPSGDDMLDLEPYDLAPSQ